MSSPGRVLVVDDDASIRESVEFALSIEGYDVCAVADGSAALAILQEWQPSVILLDMKMPGTDGWAFAAAYRARPRPHPPVIVLSAAANAGEWAAQIGADAFLGKPFTLNALLTPVEHYLGAGRS
jgi:CheY-like chemotaxis protein